MTDDVRDQAMGVDGIVGGPATPWTARAVLGALPGLLVAAGVALVALGALAPGAVVVVLGALLGLATLMVGSPRRLLGHLSTRPGDPVGEARLIGLVEAVCVADGLPPPELRILEDPAPNLLVLGGGPGDAALVVTSGLLGLVDRMELEALVAHELSHVKRGDLAVAAAATRALSPLAWAWPAAALAVLRLAGSTREALADQAAVRVTRYPPALAGALDKLAAAPSTRPAGLTPAMARLTGPLWCSPLDEARPPRPMLGVLDLGERAAALREL
jgi:heat shock protein HtpX